MAQLMDGKLVAASIYDEIKSDFTAAIESGRLKNPPKLVIVMIGNDPASGIYVKQKIKACKKLGFECVVDHHEKAENYETEDVIDIVRDHNLDKSVHGIIVQLPLPPQVDKSRVIRAISPEKDVDGLHPLSYGETTLGVEFEYYYPCTARGVIKMLEYYNIEISGKVAVVIGSGIIAGKPIAIMLSNRKATVIICNSRTPDLPKFTKLADILVVAVGSAKMVTSDMVREGVIVVDVGISKDGNENISGDVDFDNVSSKASFISPVPGGVGRLTVACLMENLLKAAVSPRKI